MSDKMEINEITGNLLDFPDGIDVAVHQANCQNIMGGGIAAQVRERYPEVYKADTEAHKEGLALLGFFSGCELRSDPSKIVLNLYGQDRIGEGRQTNSEGLYTALDRAFSLATSTKNPRHIGIPYLMGCGLAGGDWKIVRAMIDVLVEKYSIPVTIVKYDGS